MQGVAPLYHSIVSRLVDDIESGAFAESQRLPSEVALTRRYGVSRSTIREALGVLSSRGYVRKVHGVGTFLLPPPPKILEGLETLTPFVDTIARSGRKPGDQVLGVRTCSTPPDVPSAVLAGEGATGESAQTVVVNVESVRTADGRPVIYSHDYILESFSGMASAEQIEEWRTSGVSLFDVFEVKWGVQLDHSVLRARTVRARPDVSKAFGLNSDSFVLELRGTTFAVGGVPAYYSRSWFTDEYEFQFVRRMVPRSVGSDSNKTRGETQ